MLKESLQRALQIQNIKITPEQENKFEMYYNLLIQWNEKMNLTAITEESQVAVKHFEDSLAILKYIQLKPDAKVIDIGTGAGFPGIPLKIVREYIDLTLLDSLNKRLVFLQEVCGDLNFNAETLHSRAEEAGKKTEYREKYDFACSRAVARLNLLCELCLPFVKIGGLFVSMKGPGGAEEISEAESAVKILGGEICEVKEYFLSDNSKRTLVIIKKTKNTPKEFPRHGSKLKTKPL